MRYLAGSTQSLCEVQRSYLKQRTKRCKENKIKTSPENWKQKLSMSSVGWQINTKELSQIRGEYTQITQRKRFQDLGNTHPQQISVYSDSQREKCWKRPVHNGLVHSDTSLEPALETAHILCKNISFCNIFPQMFKSTINTKTTQAIKMPGSDNHKFYTVLNKKLWWGLPCWE